MAGERALFAIYRATMKKSRASGYAIMVTKIR
jgi:hypothetical protein